MESTWRIERLAQLVTAALALGTYDGQDSGRIREVPDVRTIRYYTTIGLLDRPAEMRGRTAFYGPRHVLQLVAIKKLQTLGKSLGEIQQTMLGTSNRQLLKLAGLPADFDPNRVVLPEVQEATADVPVARPAESRREFWKQSPHVSAPTIPATSSSTAAPTPVVALRIGPEATLLLEGLSPDQLTDTALASLEPGLQLLRDALARLALSHPSTDSQELPS